MSIPKYLQSALWSYNLDSINLKRHKKLVITQILNHGNWRQLQWLLKNYKLSDIKQTVLNPSRGVWLDDSLNYWETILNIKTPSDTRHRALFSLNPTNLPPPNEQDISS